MKHEKHKRNWRIQALFLFVLLCGGAIVSRLFFVQVVNRKLLKAEALGQQVDFTMLTGSRGEIYFQNSQETKGASSTGDIKSLAINKDDWTITATLKDIPNKENFAKELSRVINLQEQEILNLLNNSADGYVVLAKKLSTDQVEAVQKLNLKGLYWQDDPTRFYPQGRLASQTVGFLGGAGKGQYGLEGYYDDVLTGKSGVKQEKTGLDALFSSDEPEQLNGSNLYLTVDYNIQFQAEQLLKKYQEKFNMDSGQIIVLKPDSGKILAMANFPNFDVNQYSKVDNLEIFQNGATQKLFEPGSIMKPFTMAAALNEGKITPDTTYVDTGTLTFGPETIHNFNFEKMGKQTMTQVLENSLNTGAVFAEQQVSHKVFLNYLEKFGFFEKTGVDLQGEVASKNELLKKGHDVEYATASFGQGVELTPLQIARAFCALANGGKLVKPYIVEKIINGKEEAITKPEISENIISQKAASEINAMLMSVVDNGFNGVAKIPGYYMAGKTGTAQIPLKGGRGYDPDKTIQSFVGYGPALHPEFLILVKLDDPKVSKAALSAVPVFKDLAQYIINYWKIPPDYDVNSKK